MTLSIESSYREIEALRRDIDYLLGKFNNLQRHVDDLETELKDVHANCDAREWERA